ncbi:hypothetical protein VZO05_00925 [Aggregatilineales bacterium SYSU G02658]
MPLVGWAALLLMLLTACSTGTEAAAAPTEVVVVKSLATVVLSPTPNLDQLAATAAAASPTPAPPTPTPDPSPSPYVGVFIGEAGGGLAFQSFTQPLLGSGGAAPTADARQCGRPIEPRIVPVWQSQSVVRQRLGCPIQEPFGFFGQLQVFDRGVMYLQPDIQAVWAIVPQGTVGRFYYLEAPPPLTAPLEPSQQGLVPTGAFGSMWTLVEGLPARIGFGITEPQEVALTIQRFDSGTFLLDVSSGQAFALAVDGTVLGPYELVEPLAAPEGG